MRKPGLEQGLALFMVLAVQLVLSLLATVAIREAWLQQTMVGHAWHGASHQVLFYRAMQQLEAQWLSGGLVVHEQATLGIATNDCALSDWLERTTANRPWTLWRQNKDSAFAYLIVRWAPGACQINEASASAHTLIVQAQHKNHPPQYITALWMDKLGQRHDWRWH